MISITTSCHWLFIMNKNKKKLTSYLRDSDMEIKTSKILLFTQFRHGKYIKIEYLSEIIFT
jgi:hypothetical protein